MGRAADRAADRIEKRMASGLWGRLTPESRGAIGMTAAMFAFVCMDALAKYVSQFLPPMQVVWARYTGQTLLIALIFLPRLPSLMRSRAPGLQLLRSVLLFAATSLFFTALSLIALAEATALMQLTPLLITVLAAVVLREQVGPRRWLGVGLGLIGALIIIRPGLGVFQPASVLLLIAALCMASYHIATRMMSGADSIWTTMLYTTLFGSVAASLAVPFVWVTPEPWLWPLLAVIGTIGLVGHLSLVWALSQAPASALAPYNYTQIVWAVLIGATVFGGLPDAPTLLGAAIIVGAGLYVWHRERIAKRRLHAAVPPISAR